MPWSTSRTSCGACGRTAHVPSPRPVLEVDRHGEPGGPLRHRLCDGDHHSGVRAAVCAVGHRGPPVRAARHRLHRLDPRIAGDVDHGDAGAGVLSAVGQAATPTRRQLRRAASEARQRRACCNGRSAHRAAVFASVARWRSLLPASAAFLLPRSVPAAVQRRHAAGQRAVQSRHLARGIATGSARSPNG